MKKLNLEQMEQLEGGRWLMSSCAWSALGFVAATASLAFVTAGASLVVGAISYGIAAGNLSVSC